MRNPLQPTGAVLEPPADLPAQVAAALGEDVGTGDLTALLVPPMQRVHGRIITREAAVLCGRPWVEACFDQLDPSIRLTWQASDGATLSPGALVCAVEGPARGVLTGERTALNFLQLLSATATAASRFTAAVAGTGCTILDTRKTLPGLRTAQKYAVRCGGALNHRSGLYDAVLIKENHIAAIGGIDAAVRAARDSQPAVLIEVEVENLDELEKALDTSADRLLLDNFSLIALREAAARRDAHGGKRKELEASGGIELEGIRAVAETGVDFISVGAITKHVRATDFSMRFVA